MSVMESQKYRKCQRIRKSIAERPTEADERTEAEHWEIDLVVGKQGTKPVILTLVKRKSRKSLYVLVRNKAQKEVIAAIKRVSKRVRGSSMRCSSQLRMTTSASF